VDDPYELVYAEASRALAQQRQAFESLRTRAGVLLSGAAIASSLTVPGGQLGVFGWIAIASFAALGVALLAILWPRPEWQDTPVPSSVIETYVEVDRPLPLEVVRRDLALHMESVYDDNHVVFERLARYFRAATVLLTIEVLASVIDIAAKA
jgi:hypothetical protein